MRRLAVTPLAELQGRLQDYVLSDGSEVATVLPLLHDAAGGIPGERRLAIYYSGYRSRLREVLGSVFERTWAYLGDEEFDALCAHHIAATPSTHRNLRDYGSTFPDRLRVALPDDPEVAELAAMDWKLHTAFDAPDRTPLSAAQLAAVSEAQWQQAGFVFHPSVSLAVFEWNVLDIWHALDQGLQPPVATRRTRPLAHLFWRSAVRARFRSLGEDEYCLLQPLHAGMAFAAACARLGGDAQDAALQASAWLQRWLADELLCGITTATDE